MAKKYYLIYRVYSHKERHSCELNNRIYGWTESKNALRSFLMQRDEKKYAVFTMTLEELERRFEWNQLPEEKRLDLIKLTSVYDGQEIPFFSTAEEFEEAQKRLYRLFEELCSLSKIESKDPEKGTLYFVNLIMNLKERYFDALEYLGYRPPELRQLFDSVEESYDRLEMLGQSGSLDDVANKIIHSLEAYIRVLRDDL